MRFLIHLLALALALAVAVPATAQQQDFSKVEIKAEKLAEGVYMLTGRGGNIPSPSIGTPRRSASITSRPATRTATRSCTS
jgi:hypothetical protein